MYYNIIDYSHYPIHYISMTYLFYYWKFVRLEPLYPLYLSPSTSPTLVVTTMLFSVSMSFYLLVLLLFLDSTVSEIIQYLFLSV